MLIHIINKTVMKLATSVETYFWFMLPKHKYSKFIYSRNCYMSKFILESQYSIKK